MRKKPYFIKLIVLLGLALALAACGGQATTQAPAPTQVPPTKAPAPTEAPPTEVPPVVGDPARGEALFNQDTIGPNNAPACKTCHSVEPGKVLVGPSLAGMALDAAEDNPSDPAGFVRQAIVDPNAEIASGFQPNIMYQNFGKDLSEQDIADLVAYLMTLTEEGGEEAAVEGNPIRGGLLYDKWWDVTGADEPAAAHPLWAGEAEEPAATWRCKECHGWLYTGEGDYPGVLDLAGTDPNQILAALEGGTNPDHDFSTVMEEQDLADLALFISEKVYDTSAIVDADGKPVNGDPAAGQEKFTICAACHGPQGLAINFHHDEPEPPEYIPTIAQEDPGEFLSKAHWGQPGHPEMPAGDAMGFQTQDFANLVAYLQQFPTSSPLTEGGQMFDKWWKAAVVDPPEGDMPLWSQQDTNTRSGTDTWRCKECHGWDYLGVEGVYSSGSHSTGFPGIFAAKDKSAEEILAALTGQTNPDHDFSPYLDADRLEALVTFIQQGLIDKSQYINDDKSVNGDADHGEQLYSTTCARCHGSDGTEINFGDEDSPEFVGTVAADNPWEFLNKGSFGQPGEAMPAGLNMGWSWQDIADLAAYAQTLPTSK